MVDLLRKQDETVVGFVDSECECLEVKGETFFTSMYIRFSIQPPNNGYCIFILSVKKTVIDLRHVVRPSIISELTDVSVNHQTGKIQKSFKFRFQPKRLDKN